MKKSSFQRLTGTEGLPPALHDCVVAIGNFDGVHRGHQAVLERALELAERESRPAVVLTFEPHPRSFFKQDQPVDRLTDAAEKAEILRLMGFDAVMEQPLRQSFRSVRRKISFSIFLLKSCVRAASSPVTTFISARDGAARRNSCARRGKRPGSVLRWSMPSPMRAGCSFLQRASAIS